MANTISIECKCGHTYCLVKVIKSNYILMDIMNNRPFIFPKDLLNNGPYRVLYFIF